MEKNEQAPELAPATLKLSKTLKRGLRAVWDSLGLVCGMSLTIFVAAILTAYPAIILTRVVSIPTPFAALASLFCFALLPAPLYGGCCFLAAKILEHDEPSYADLWIGSLQMYSKLVAISLIQIAVMTLLISHLLFYSNRSGLIWLALAIVSLYLIIFWFINCLYHFPVLVSAQQGIVRREDGGPPRISAVFRNAFVMAMAAPRYSICLFAVMLPFWIL